MKVYLQSPIRSMKIVYPGFLPNYDDQIPHFFPMKFIFFQTNFPTKFKAYS